MPITKGDDIQYDNVEIRADEVRAVVKKFERRIKSGRVFFPDGAAVAMKCETLLKNAASGIQGLSVSGRSFTAVDRTTYSEADAAVAKYRTMFKVK